MTTSINQANNKKNLSKGVGKMRFMQCSSLKEEKDKLLAEEQMAIDAEHWCLDTSERPKQDHSFLIEPSYVICGELIFGRRSYKGFNQEIEKLCKVLDATPTEEVVVPEMSVTDIEMAHTMGSFSKKHSKRRAKEMKQRAADDYDKLSDVEAESPLKTKKRMKFLKPMDEVY